MPVLQWVLGTASTPAAWAAVSCYSTPAANAADATEILPPTCLARPGRWAKWRERQDALTIVVAGAQVTMWQLLEWQRRSRKGAGSRGDAEVHGPQPGPCQA